MQYKPGDVVQLKSGGPKMTVVSYLVSSEVYRCQWFKGSKCEQGNFPEANLVPAVDDAGKKATK